MAAMAALLCAAIASLAPAVAAAEGTGELAEYPWAGNFPDIASSSSPEEYEARLEQMRPGDVARQVSEREVVIFNPEGDAIGWVYLGIAHDADGASVPTSLRLVEGDEVITTVHHREGNPAAGGAPFAYPIMGGPGWEGGYRTVTFELSEPKPPPSPAPASPTPPAPTCTVPTLHGLSLRAAKSRLRAADCSIGGIRLVRGATAAKGHVVKQFQPAGRSLVAGAPVAVKLG